MANPNRGSGRKIAPAVDLGEIPGQPHFRKTSYVFHVKPAWIYCVEVDFVDDEYVVIDTGIYLEEIEGDVYDIARGGDVSRNKFFPVPRGTRFRRADISHFAPSVQSFRTYGLQAQLDAIKEVA